MAHRPNDRERDREAGGTPETPRELADPLLEVMREGLPDYQRGSCEEYANRIDETERDEHAPTVRDGDEITTQIETLRYRG